MHTTSLRQLIRYGRARKTGKDIRTTVPAGTGPTLPPRPSMAALRAV